MSKMQKIQKFGVLMLIIFMLSIGLGIYSNTLVNNIDSSACDTLNELTQQQRFNMDNKMEMDVNSIKSLAQALSYVDVKLLTDVDFLKELQRNTSFKYMAFIEKTGRTYTSNSQILQVGDRDYFKKAISGQTVVSVPVLSRIDEVNMIIPIATPVYINNMIVGVLMGVYNTDSLKAMILPSYGGQGVAYITDEQGNIIIRPDLKVSDTSQVHGINNVIEGLDKSKIVANDSLNTIKLNMQYELSGHSSFELDGVKSLTHYAPLAFNGWFLFMVVPEKAISRQASNVIQNSILLAACVLAIVIAFLILLLIQQQRAENEREANTEKLEKLAYYDELTGAASVYRFKEMMNEALIKNIGSPSLLIKFDITNFKLINEIHGFETGNMVLKAIKDSVDEIAQKQNGCLVFCTRMNADEFVVFDGNEANGSASWEALIKVINPKIKAIIKHWRFELCCGRYYIEVGEYDVVKALEKVNIAHRTARKDNCRTVCDYNISLQESSMEKMEIENKMEHALNDNQFKVYLQPKYELKNETIHGAEALVRWQTDDGEIISPIKFISIFESNGFILQLDFYMFEKVCQLIECWKKDEKKLVPISVNFSRLHLTNPDFVAQLVEISNKYNVDRSFLEIELTESVFFDNAVVIENLLNDLRCEGFSLSIDDFGTGYSSLGLLKDLPVDIIKIDQSFFSNNRYSDRAKSVIESVVQMAKKLNIFTVAEGVESKEHVDLLRKVGCDVVQGYYYSKPKPAEDFELHMK